LGWRWRVRVRARREEVLLVSLALSLFVSTSLFPFVRPSSGRSDARLAVDPSRRARTRFLPCNLARSLSLSRTRGIVSRMSRVAIQRIGDGREGRQPSSRAPPPPPAHLPLPPRSLSNALLAPLTALQVPKPLPLPVPVPSPRPLGPSPSPSRAPSSAPAAHARGGARGRRTPYAVEETVAKGERGGAWNGEGAGGVGVGVGSSAREEVGDGEGALDGAGGAGRRTARRGGHGRQVRVR